MRTLFAWKLTALGIVSVWLGMAFVAIRPLPDWHEGVLVVAIPSTGLNGDAAFELELVTLFSQQLKVNLKTVVLEDAQVESALLERRVHFSATGMRKRTSSTLKFSPVFQTLSEQIICQGSTPRRFHAWPEALNVVVVAESAQAQALAELTKRFPRVQWSVTDEQSSSALLQQVAEGHLSCTVANEEQIALVRNFYPQLGDSVDLSSPSSLAWGFAAEGDAELLQQATLFIKRIQQDGTLTHLLDRHYGHSERLESIDVSTFMQNAQNVLPQYVNFFEEAARQTGFDWTLLAALAYQESHWDPLATSFTNVRGMMMLTEGTASRMKVVDRLNAKESIFAGAYYLKILKDSLPLRINERERTWMALAAYNQGMGHLEDARVLAAQSGLNPDIWADVRKVMPLLSRPAYYETSKHGQARGGEAVILVETVRLYQEMLQRKPDVQRAWILNYLIYN
jgi:membrane-bound lytic murein transglycosylase F